MRMMRGVVLLCWWQRYGVQDVLERDGMLGIEYICFNKRGKIH